MSVVAGVASLIVPLSPISAKRGLLSKRAAPNFLPPPHVLLRHRQHDGLEHVGLGRQRGHQ